MKIDHFIAIVDDDDMLREMLCLMLHSLKLTVKGYASAQAFLADPDWRNCLCLVLDQRMPGMSGIELQRRLKKDNVQLPIVFMTAHGEVPMVVEAIKEGAVDFLQKPLQAQAFLDCVQRCVEEAPRRRQQFYEMDVMRARLANLTPREREVLEQIVEGKRSKNIADTLGVSLNTVEQYRSKILQKMHASSTPDLLSQLSPYLKDLGLPGHG